MRLKIDKDTLKFFGFIIFFLSALSIAGCLELEDEPRCYMAETEESDEQVEICW